MKRPLLVTVAVVLGVFVIGVSTTINSHSIITVNNHQQQQHLSNIHKNSQQMTAMNLMLMMKSASNKDNHNMDKDNPHNDDDDLNSSNNNNGNRHSDHGRYNAPMMANASRIKRATDGKCHKGSIAVGVQPNDAQVNDNCNGLFEADALKMQACFAFKKDRDDNQKVEYECQLIDDTDQSTRILPNWCKNDNDECKTANYQGETGKLCCCRTKNNCNAKFANVFISTTTTAMTTTTTTEQAISGTSTPWPPYLLEFIISASVLGGLLLIAIGLHIAAICYICHLKSKIREAIEFEKACEKFETCDQIQKDIMARRAVFLEAKHKREDAKKKPKKPPFKDPCEGVTMEDKAEQKWHEQGMKEGWLKTMVKKERKKLMVQREVEPLLNAYNYIKSIEDKTNIDLKHIFDVATIGEQIGADAEDLLVMRKFCEEKGEDKDKENGGSVVVSLKTARSPAHGSLLLSSAVKSAPPSAVASLNVSTEQQTASKASQQLMAE